MNPVRTRNWSAATTTDLENWDEPPAQRRRTSDEPSGSSLMLPPRSIPASGSMRPRADPPQAGTMVSTTSGTLGTPGASANPDSSRAAAKRYMIGHFGLSPEEAEEALGNVKTPQPRPGPILTATSGPSRPSSNPALIGGNEERQQGLDQVTHTHDMGAIQQTTQGKAPARRMTPERAQIAARIKVQLPRLANEAAKDWAHRICETDQEIQNIDRGRLALLSEIMGVRTDQLKQYSLLAARSFEIKRAQEIRVRHGQAVGESKAAWARRLAAIPELRSLEERARQNLIACVIRASLWNVQTSLQVHSAASVGSTHDLVMRVAGVSQHELEEALSDVEKQPFAAPMMPTVPGPSVAYATAPTSGQLATEDGSEMVDELLATSGGMILPHEGDPLEKMAREIAIRLPRIKDESDTEWAHRICETDEKVQSCAKARIRLLQKITGGLPSTLSSFPMLTARKEEIEQALDRRSRLPRRRNETKQDWVRRLATLEDFNGKRPDEIKLPIARIIRGQSKALSEALSLPSKSKRRLSTPTPSAHQS